MATARAGKQQEPHPRERWSPSRPLNDPHPSALLEVTRQEYDALVADLDAPAEPSGALRRTMSLHPLPTE